MAFPFFAGFLIVRAQEWLNPRIPSIQAQVLMVDILPGLKAGDSYGAA
jgi:hypothetical protein